MSAHLVRLTLAVGLALTLGACSAAPVPAPVVAGGVTLVASGTAFDRSQIVVPANRASSLVFENRDGAPHNVSISPAGYAPVFVGEIFTGPASRVYAVPGLPFGRYTFRCDVHPEMSGTVVSQ
jgi:plastocyanin